MQQSATVDAFLQPLRQPDQEFAGIPVSTKLVVIESLISWVKSSQQVEFRQHKDVVSATVCACLASPPAPLAFRVQLCSAIQALVKRDTTVISTIVSQCEQLVASKGSDASPAQVAGYSATEAIVIAAGPAGARNCQTLLTGAVKVAKDPSSPLPTRLSAFSALLALATNVPQGVGDVNGIWNLSVKAVLDKSSAIDCRLKAAELLLALMDSGLKDASPHNASSTVIRVLVDKKAISWDVGRWQLSELCGKICGKSMQLVAAGANSSSSKPLEGSLSSLISVMISQVPSRWVRGYAAAATSACVSQLISVGGDEQFSRCLRAYVDAFNQLKPQENPGDLRDIVAAFAVCLRRLPISVTNKNISILSSTSKLVALLEDGGKGLHPHALMVVNQEVAVRIELLGLELGENLLQSCVDSCLSNLEHCPLHVVLAKCRLIRALASCMPGKNQLATRLLDDLMLPASCVVCSGTGSSTNGAKKQEFASLLQDALIACPQNWTPPAAEHSSSLAMLLASVFASEPALGAGDGFESVTAKRAALAAVCFSNCSSHPSASPHHKRLVIRGGLAILSCLRCLPLPALQSFTGVFQDVLAIILSGGVALPGTTEEVVCAMTSRSNVVDCLADLLRAAPQLGQSTEFQELIPDLLTKLSSSPLLNKRPSLLVEPPPSATGDALLTVASDGLRSALFRLATACPPQLCSPLTSSLLDRALKVLTSGRGLVGTYMQRCANVDSLAACMVSDTTVDQSAARLAYEVFEGKVFATPVETGLDLTLPWSILPCSDQPSPVLAEDLVDVSIEAVAFLFPLASAKEQTQFINVLLKAVVIGMQPSPRRTGALENIARASRRLMRSISAYGGDSSQLPWIPQLIAVLAACLSLESSTARYNAAEAIGLACRRSSPATLSSTLSSLQKAPNGVAQLSQSNMQDGDLEYSCCGAALAIGCIHNNAGGLRCHPMLRHSLESLRRWIDDGGDEARGTDAAKIAHQLRASSLWAMSLVVRSAVQQAGFAKHALKVADSLLTFEEPLFSEGRLHTTPPTFPLVVMLVEASITALGHEARDQPEGGVSVHALSLHGQHLSRFYPDGMTQQTFSNAWSSLCQSVVAMMGPSSSAAALSLATVWARALGNGQNVAQEIKTLTEVARLNNQWFTVVSPTASESFIKLLELGSALHDPLVRSEIMRLANDILREFEGDADGLEGCASAAQGKAVPWNTSGPSTFEQPDGAVEADSNNRLAVEADDEDEGIISSAPKSGAGSASASLGMCARIAACRALVLKLQRLRGSNNINDKSLTKSVPTIVSAAYNVASHQNADAQCAGLAVIGACISAFGNVKDSEIEDEDVYLLVQAEAQLLSVCRACMGIQVDPRVLNDCSCILQKWLASPVGAQSARRVSSMLQTYLSVLPESKDSDRIFVSDARRQAASNAIVCLSSVGAITKDTSIFQDLSIDLRSEISRVARGLVVSHSGPGRNQSSEQVQSLSSLVSAESRQLANDKCYGGILELLRLALALQQADRLSISALSDIACRCLSAFAPCCQDNFDSLLVSLQGCLASILSAVRSQPVSNESFSVIEVLVSKPFVEISLQIPSVTESLAWVLVQGIQSSSEELNARALECSKQFIAAFWCEDCNTEGGVTQNTFGFTVLTQLCKLVVTGHSSSVAAAETIILLSRDPRMPLTCMIKIAGSITSVMRGISLDAVNISTTVLAAILIRVFKDAKADAKSELAPICHTIASEMIIMPASHHRCIPEVVNVLLKIIKAAFQHQYESEAVVLGSACVAWISVALECNSFSGPGLNAVEGCLSFILALAQCSGIQGSAIWDTIGMKLCLLGWKQQGSASQAATNCLSAFKASCEGSVKSSISKLTQDEKQLLQTGVLAAAEAAKRQASSRVTRKPSSSLKMEFGSFS